MRLVLAALLSSLIAAPAAPGRGSEHLASVLGDLETTAIPVLVPPERPAGTTATLVDADDHFYRLLFTNDPDGTLAHAEQVNVLVTGRAGPLEPPADAVPVEVRGTEGAFSCGASACFLDWEEDEVAYSVGEFGGPEDAVAFAGSLIALEDVVTSREREPAPQDPPGGLPAAGIVVAAVAAALALVGGMMLLRSLRRG